MTKDGFETASIKEISDALKDEFRVNNKTDYKKLAELFEEVIFELIEMNWNNDCVITSLLSETTTQIGNKDKFITNQYKNLFEQDVIYDTDN